MVIFHSYVSLPEGIDDDHPEKKMLGKDGQGTQVLI